MVNWENANRPLFSLTVGEFTELLNSSYSPQPQEKELAGQNRHYVYGYKGIATLFGCSISTASRIKLSGEIDKAISQVGRTITVDADLALQLVGKKRGGKRE